MPQNRWPKPELAEIGGSEMRVLLSTWGSRGDVEPMLGFAVRVAGTRRGGADVRAAGLRGAAGPGRRADGSGRPVGARAGARGEAAVAGGRASGRGRVGRRAVRHGRRGGRGMRRAGGDRPDAGRRAVDSRDTGHPLRRARPSFRAYCRRRTTRRCRGRAGRSRRA